MNRNSFDHKRRLFIGGVALAAASLYVAAVGRGARKTCGVEDVDVSALDLQPLIRIGHAYLEEVAMSGNSRTLRKDLLADVPMTLASIAGSYPARFVGGGGRAEEEFQRGEIVSCDGWVLSKSEARLCAMIAIADRHGKVYVGQSGPFMAVGSIANGVCNIWNERINRFSRRSYSFASPIYLPSHVELSAAPFTRTAAASRLGQRLQGSPSPTLWTGGALSFGHLSRRHFRFLINEG